MEDHHWLVSDTGVAALAIAEEMLRDCDLVAANSRLRKRFSASQTRLLLEQAVLRQRAANKFAHAQRMFFTDIALQQASGETIARYKAQRFPVDKEAFDLCCGIGGDLFSLAQRGPVIGIERDPIVALLAEANCQALGLSEAEVRTADVTSIPPSEMSLVHIDPDRRPQGRRTTNVSLHEPDAEYLQALTEKSGGGAIKLAPATDATGWWQANCELEWISHGGECKQLLAWFGELATHPGLRTATMLTRSGDAHSLSRNTAHDPPSRSADHDPASRNRAHDPPLQPASTIGRFVYEPDPSVIAAKLVRTLAETHSLRAIAPQVAYMTGDAVVTSGLLSAFEVIDHRPMDRKQVKAMLGRHGVGRLEIKKRGVTIDPARLQRELHGEGDKSATLIVSPHNRRVMAILARRVFHPEGESSQQHEGFDGPPFQEGHP